MDADVELAGVVGDDDHALEEPVCPDRSPQRPIEVRPTLFYSWAVVQEWGRIGFAGGARRETWFETETEARQYGERLARTKQRRGYVVVP